MLRTIAIGPYLSIQGLLIDELSDGQIRISLDHKIYTGFPIPKIRAA